MRSQGKADKDELSELIGAIYAAGLEPGRWTDVLERLERRGSDEYMQLALVHPDPARSASLGIRGLPPNSIERYRQHFFKLNPWLHLSERVPSGTAIDASRFLSPIAVRDTEFYVDWLRHLPADCPVAVLSGASDQPRLCLTIVKPFADRQGRAAALASLQRLSPHLGRAMAVGRMNAAAAAHRALDQSVLASLAVGILYAASEGRVVYANPAADDMLRSKDGIRLDAGRRLAALEPQTSDRLMRLIGEAADPASPQARAGGGSIALPRRDGLPALAVLISPLPGGQAALFLRRPEESPRLHTDLAAILNLTQAEAEVAKALAMGATVEDIAKTRRVSEITIRNQIKSALQKTGVNRQAELLRLVWRASPDLR